MGLYLPITASLLPMGTAREGRDLPHHRQQGPHAEDPGSSPLVPAAARNHSSHAHSRLPFPRSPGWEPRLCSPDTLLCPHSSSGPNKGEVLETLSGRLDRWTYPNQ